MGRGHLQIRCIFFLIKLGSLALCAFPPGILRLLFLFLLCSYFPSPLRQDPALCVAQAVPRGGGPRFPVFIGLPSAEAQLAVLLRAFSGLDSVTISYLIMITKMFHPRQPLVIFDHYHDPFSGKRIFFKKKFLMGAIMVDHKAN